MYASLCHIWRRASDSQSCFLSHALPTKLAEIRLTLYCFIDNNAIGAAATATTHTNIYWIYMNIRCECDETCQWSPHCDHITCVWAPSARFTFYYLLIERKFALSFPYSNTHTHTQWEENSKSKINCGRKTYNFYILVSTPLFCVCRG